jgi:hypothetical protein
VCRIHLTACRGGLEIFLPLVVDLFKAGAGQQQDKTPVVRKVDIEDSLPFPGNRYVMFTDSTDYQYSFCCVGIENQKYVEQIAFSLKKGERKNLEDLDSDILVKLKVFRVPFFRAWY